MHEEEVAKGAGTREEDQLGIRMAALGVWGGMVETTSERGREDEQSSAGT